MPYEIPIYQVQVAHSGLPDATWSRWRDHFDEREAIEEARRISEAVLGTGRRFYAARVVKVTTHEIWTSEADSGNG